MLILIVFQLLCLVNYYCITKSGKMTFKAHAVVYLCRCVRLEVKMLNSSASGMQQAANSYVKIINLEFHLTNCAQHCAVTLEFRTVLRDVMTECLQL